MRWNLFQAKKPIGAADPSGDAEMEIRHNVWSRQRLFLPDSANKIRWERLLLFLATYSALELPMLFAFSVKPHAALLTVDYVVDLVFWVDIAISLRTTFIVKDTNALELDPKVVMHRYTHGWMAPEVLGAFPLEVFVGGVSALDTAHGLRDFNALRLVRWIMRVVSARFKPGKTLTSPPKGTNVVAMRLMRISRLCIYFLLLAHWTGCFWWALGESESHLNGKIYADTAYAASLLRRKGTTQLDAWLVRPNQGGLILSVDSSLGHRYLSGMYWSLTTLMKASWIPPGTTYEKLYAACNVFMGALLFAFLLANTSAVVNAFDEANAKRRGKIAMMRRFARTRKLTPAVTKQLLMYVDAEW